MKRNVKKMLISCLSVASIACGALALGNVTTATAEGETPVIALQDGASCRIKFDETEQVNTGGIRFTADLDQTQWQALISANAGAELSAGVIVVPTDYVTKAGGYKHENLLALAEEYGLQIADCSYTAEEIGTETELAGSVINILDKNYTRDFSGVAYLKSSVAIDGWESYDGAWYSYAAYDEAKNVRNIYEVAYNAYNDRTASATTVGETNYNKSVTFNDAVSYSPYSDDQRDILKGYLDGVLDVTKDGFGDIVTVNDTAYYTSPYSLQETSADTWIVPNGSGLKAMQYGGAWKEEDGRYVSSGTRRTEFNVTDGKDTLTLLESQNATFNADGSVTLAQSNVNGAWASAIAQRNYNYIAFKGEYGIGTYIDFTFTGNNLPNVLLFADQINGNLTSDGGSGILLTNYGQSTDRFNAYGPTRIHTTGVNEQTATSNTTYTDNTNRLFSWYDAQNTANTRTVCPLLTQNGLKADTSGSEYKYTVGTYLESGYIVLDIQLYNVTTDESVYNMQTTTKLTESDVSAGSIVVHGTIGTNLGATTFSYGLPYEKQVAYKGATFNDDGSVTLNGMSVSGAGYTSQIAELSANYVGLKGVYGVGTYIDVEFTGNNLPNVLFFANEINDQLTGLNGDKGLMIAGGINTASNSNNDRLVVCGPNRIPAAYSSAGDLIEGGSDNRNDATKNPNGYYSATYGWIYNQLDRIAQGSYSSTTYSLLTQTGLNADTSGDTYRYTVGTYLSTNGYIVVSVSLYNVTDEVDVYKDAEITTKLTSEDVEAGSIVLYGVVKGSNNATTFSYSEPYTKEGNNKGATFNGDGSVTLDGYGLSGAGYSSQLSLDMSANYIGLAGEYGIGTYIDVTFTGNNLPNVLFFADEINDDITSFGGKGLMIAGGINANSRNQNKLVVFGPNRIPAAYDANSGLDKEANGYYSATFGWVYDQLDRIAIDYIKYDNYPLLTQTGLKEDATGTAYKYTIGTYLNDDGYIVVHIQLRDATTEELITNASGAAYDIRIATGLTRFDVKAGNIVIYGAVKGASDPTTFSYSAPYEGGVEEVAMLAYSYGAPGTHNLAYSTKAQYETYANTGLNALFLTGNNAFGSADTWEGSNAQTAFEYAKAAGVDRFIFRDNSLIFQTPYLIGTDTDEIDYRFATVDELDAYVAERLALYINVDGFYGVGINDEPQFALAETVGQVYQSIKRVAKQTYGKDVYVQLNLLPYETAGWTRFFSEEMVENASQISTAGRNMATDYASYLDAFFMSTKAEIMTADIYPYRVNNTFLSTYFDGLRIFAEKCNEYGAEMGIVMQSFDLHSATAGYREVVSDAEMSLQMNVVLGFGAKQYAFYYYEGRTDNDDTYDWDTDCAFIDAVTGETTEIYTWASNAIAQAQKLDNLLAKYVYQGASLQVKDASASYADYYNMQNDVLTVGNVTFDKDVLLITQLYRESNGTYLYTLQNVLDSVYAEDQATEMSVSVTFEGYTKAAVFSNGAWSYVALTDGVYTTGLAVGEAVYVIPLN